jgi:Lrp/AsnC family leucine-responsive transcriptional regulator
MWCPLWSPFGRIPLASRGFTVLTLGEILRAAIEFSPGWTQNLCVKLDEIDHLLLDELQADAGRTLRELGEVVGLSPSAVQRRMDRYRETGLLARVSAVLDPKVTHDLVMAVVLVAVERDSPRMLAPLQRRLLAAPEVQQLYVCYGEWDYIVVLTTSGMAHHKEVSERLFTETPNVRRYSTMLVVDPLRTGMAIPTRALKL